MNNPLQIIMQFVNAVRQRHGNNFDPAQMSQNMMGRNYSSSQEALQDLVNRKVITQEQYNNYLKIL